LLNALRLTEDDLYLIEGPMNPVRLMALEKFSSVIEFIESAAMDPDVLAIKMTLYRTGATSGLSTR
jgi:hypothetical protein